MLIVSIASQEMALLVEGEIEKIYPISTSKNPPSCVENSFGTPLGLHQLADFIGAGEPEGTVFHGRKPTKHFLEYSKEAQLSNLITSRIIRIRGLEPGRNSGDGQDSYDRYVYIHGTNHENRIGEPFSGGCIEMLNAQVVELYKEVQPGDLLAISAD
ncbi:MAG TPA: L,D-transpeptidase [Opitutae bacterium]|nr:L,D-transpeptidase [Opitutae bacterium]